MCGIEPNTLLKLIELTNYMTDNFFPEDYDIPSSGSDFLKPDKGELVFRVLAPVTMGYEYWTDDNKSFRSLTPFETLAPNAKKQENKKTGEHEVVKPKHIWVMPVWNYGTKSVDILTIGQKTIQESILALAKDADWGSPMTYDIKIVGEGDGFERKYAVSPKPKKDLDASVAEAYAKAEASTLKAIADLFV